MSIKIVNVNRYKLLNVNDASVNVSKYVRE